jgi:hypothetical protein
VVERRLPVPPPKEGQARAYRPTTVDLFGAFDVLAVRADKGILAVQCCAATDHAKRVRKVKEAPAVRAWLASGGLAEVWSWKKTAGRWFVRREAITLESINAQ